MGHAALRSGALHRLCGLGFTFAAAGMSDGYFEKGLASWDKAAGAPLVQEAGGLIGNFTW